jgi:hypothetical protein
MYISLPLKVLTVESLDSDRYRIMNEVKDYKAHILFCTVGYVSIALI